VGPSGSDRGSADDLPVVDGPDHWQAREEQKKAASGWSSWVSAWVGDAADHCRCSRTDRPLDSKVWPATSARELA